MGKNLCQAQRVIPKQRKQGKSCPGFRRDSGTNLIHISNGWRAIACYSNALMADAQDIFIEVAVKRKLRCQRQFVSRAIQRYEWVNMEVGPWVRAKHEILDDLPANLGCNTAQWRQIIPPKGIGMDHNVGFVWIASVLSIPKEAEKFMHGTNGHQSRIELLKFAERISAQGERIGSANRGGRPVLLVRKHRAPQFPRRRIAFETSTPLETPIHKFTEKDPVSRV